MAESNVMGTYKFPPNVFNKILDNFKDELIREDIKRKQGGTNDREGC